MRKSITIISVASIIILQSCANPAEKSPKQESYNQKDSVNSEVENSSRVIACSFDSTVPLPSGQFVNVVLLAPTVIVDMPYADTSNFTHTQIYQCPVCELQAEVALGIMYANMSASAMGYRIKVFDCYRPSSAQQKMYDVVPDKKYVAHPSKGSKHSSGCAVDVTLCNAQGELDMGTSFDDFSEKSHLGYKGLSKEQQQNRALLLQIMKGVGFSEYTNEWWHFNFIGCDHPQDDHHWECK